MSIPYPGPNDGAVPFDPSTPTGQFRASVGDTSAEEYVPEESGRGNYVLFSDLEIEGFLAAAQGNVSRGIGFGYLALAGQAARESKLVSDFDLRIDTTKRASDFRLIAQQWFDRAAQEDAANQDALFIAPLGESCEPVPEGMMPQWGRYAVGKWKC